MNRATFTFLLLVGWGADSRAGAICDPSAKSADSCDSRLRHYLNTAKSGDDQRRVWEKGGEQQRRLRAALLDLFSTVDAKGRTVIDKADEVVRLAEKLEIVGKNLPQQTRTKAHSDSMFSHEEAYSVNLLPEPASAEVVATVMPAAKEFQQAVIDFAKELSQRCSTRPAPSRG